MKFEPYRQRQLHPDDTYILDNITAPSNWDSTRFRQVLVALAMLGNAESIPAKNCPESIHLQTWRRHIDDLLRRTHETGLEHSRAVLADVQKRSVVMSGKISVGTESSVTTNIQKQPGRERFQSLIGTIHTHPVESGGAAHAFSDQDYISFLSDPNEQVMVVAYGDNYRLMVLKTSVTPNNLTRESLERRVHGLRDEYLNAKEGSFYQQAIYFNKEVCTEFGLVFYMASNQSNDMFERVRI